MLLAPCSSQLGMQAQREALNSGRPDRQATLNLMKGEHRVVGP